MQPDTSDGKVMVAISRSTSNLIAINTVLDQNGNILFTEGQPVNLPFCLFGSNDLGTPQGPLTGGLYASSGNYNVMLKQALFYLGRAFYSPCVGIEITLTVKINPSNGSVQFIYRDPVAGVQDIVTVYYPGTNNSNYLQQLASTIQKENHWRAKNINYSVSDGAAFNAQAGAGIIQFYEISSGGAVLTSEELKSASIQAEDNPSNGRLSIICDEIMHAGKGILDWIIPCPGNDIGLGIPFQVYYFITKDNIGKK